MSVGLFGVGSKSVPFVGERGRVLARHNDARLVARRPPPVPVVSPSEAAPEKVVYAAAAAPVVGLTARRVLRSHTLAVS